MRALRWQRIAPPFAGGALAASATTLQDRHAYAPGETWYAPADGRTLAQAAPAILARGLAPPEVDGDDPAGPPFVVASRHPNGAVAVATLPRSSASASASRTRIALRLDETPRHLAVFGDARGVSVTWPAGPAGPGGRVAALGQDLADDAPDAGRDVADRLRLGRGTLTLDPASLLRLVRSATTPGDASPPRLILRLVRAH